MYALVNLAVPRQNPPLLIPGDTLLVRSDGPQVALVRPDNSVHFAHVQLGRDYGDFLEVLDGLELGDRVIANPGDLIREGVKVKPVQAAAAPAKN